MKITTPQAPSAQPLVIADSPTDTWTVLADAPIYSVPDTTFDWPDSRDPDDAGRRMQPGQIVFVSPLFFHNTDTVEHLLELQIRTESGSTYMQASVTIPPSDTYAHPIGGLYLTKTGLDDGAGDRLEARTDTPTAGLIHVTGAAEIASADGPREPNVTTSSGP